MAKLLATPLATPLAKAAGKQLMALAVLKAVLAI
jgi:hypothetical protein